MRALADRTCEPCRGGTRPLCGEELKDLASDLGGDWEVVGGHHLLKKYRFKDFAEALTFVNRVGAVAETEGHHPNVSFGWGYSELVIYTHAIDGLSESDFILAATSERISP